MFRLKSAAALFALLTCAGCKMCCSYTDNLPPVLDGPYSHVHGRAGSILSGGYQSPLYGPVTELPEVGDQTPVED